MDCSGINFVATANDKNKISPQILSRMVVVELKGYSFGEKKRIVSLFTKDRLNYYGFSPDLIKFGDDSIETLINKTSERGIRQLRSAVEKIINHCLVC